MDVSSGNNSVSPQGEISSTEAPAPSSEINEVLPEQGSDLNRILHLEPNSPGFETLREQILRSLREAKSVQEARRLFRIDLELEEDRILLPGLDPAFEYYPPVLTTRIADCEVKRCQCGVDFSLLCRRHHCRACQRIFCGTCASAYMNIPSCLSPTHLEQRGVRVCRSCHFKLNAYYVVEDFILFFELLALPLTDCYRATQVCPSWREALRFYLSHLRDLRELPPSTTLTPAEKRALQTNRDLLLGHGSWLLVRTRLGGPLESPRLQLCCLTLCGPGCRNDVVLDELLYVLSLNYPEDVQHEAIRLLEHHNLENRLPLVYQLAVKNKALWRLLIQKGSANAKFFIRLYWASLICANRSYNVLREEILLTNREVAVEIIKSAGLLDIMEGTEPAQLPDQLMQLKMPLFGPTGMIENISRQLSYKNSKTRPVILHCQIDAEPRALMYKREDVRKDLYVQIVSQVILEILNRAGLNPPLASYQVVPTSQDGGFIEIVNSAKTIREILLDGSLSNYMQIHNPDVQVGDLHSRYLKSLALWTVICWILGVGDRHLENIMLRRDAVLFNIDFSYLFGQDLKSTIGPQVRIDRDLLEGLGGNNVYDSFKNVCVQYFLAIRREYRLVYSTLLLFTRALPPIQGLGVLSAEYLEKYSLERFLLGRTEHEVGATFEAIIDQSRDSFVQTVTDSAHALAGRLPSFNLSFF